MAPSVLAGEETIPLLEAGTQTFSNVTVTSKTSRYIIVSHSQGMSSIKLKDLSDDVLKQLGYAVEPPPPPKPKPGAVLFATVTSDPRIKGIQEKVAQEAQDRLRELGWIEGRTVAFEYRFAEGRTDRAAEIVAEFVRMRVDLSCQSFRPI